jgi:hypothetical protein
MEVPHGAFEYLGVGIGGKSAGIGDADNDDSKGGMPMAEGRVHCNDYRWNLLISPRCCVDRASFCEP